METSRKEIDDLQISCKEKRDEVTGMGKGIKGHGWVGRTDGEVGSRHQHKGETGKTGRKVVFIGGERSRGEIR